MGKTITKIINRFDGGMTNDLRSTSPNKYALTKHFDAFTYPHKLVPQYKTEALEDKTMLISDFVYCKRSATEYRLFGFGASADSKSKVYMLDVDAAATSWAEPANNASGIAKNAGCFFYYKNYIYMWGSTNKLCRFDVDSGDSFNDAYQTLSGNFSTIAQPVHHPADDIAYFFTDNKVHTLNDTSWSEAALTLPDNLKIVAGCAYGNYLAIACVVKGTAELKSIVYLWDRDSSLATLTERIDFGQGQIRNIASLDNKLIAIMDVYIPSTLAVGRGKLAVKQAYGQFAVTLNEIYADDTASLPAKTEFVKDNKIYFAYSIPKNNDTRLGIWAVDSYGRISLEIVVEDATSYQGIYCLGNTWYIAHSADGSVDRIDDNKAYSTTNPSIYESLILNEEDSSVTKKLIGVEVMTEPLPSAGQVILKYRSDGDLDGSWTTVFTETTDDSISHGAINIESSGVNLPEYKEIQFRIESTGGAVITGLKYKFEVIDKDVF